MEPRCHSHLNAVSHTRHTGQNKKKARNKKQNHETEDRTHDAAIPKEESFGPLVMLGFDVAVFTPASYLRHRL